MSIHSLKDPVGFPLAWPVWPAWPACPALPREHWPSQLNLTRRIAARRFFQVSHFWVSMFDKAIGDPSTELESRNMSGNYKLDNAAYLYFFKVRVHGLLADAAHL